jgi:hypothetical protein
MSSGRKALRQNTRERVISSDWNRQQSFIAGYANEQLRRQMLAPQDDSYYVGATFTAPGPLSAALDILAPAAPDYAGVLNGLMVVVPAAATYVLVTAGMLGVIDPEGTVGSSDPTPLSPDDGPGPCRVVYSPGVSVAGALAWAPNPGPGLRVDVVEVQRANVVSETDNRDIFDPSTGLFTPQAVTKVTVGELTYRIRQGVPGGGLPAPALGWVPLAVISSAAASVNLDTATVWDVRPLLSDLADPYAPVRSVFPRVERYRMMCDRRSTPGQLKLSGESQGSYLGLRTGGLFVEPGSTPFIDLLNAPVYQAAGFIPIPSLPWYLYALFPGGYVRWVRYWPTAVAGAGGRVPGPMRGVLAVSQTVPFNGQPLAPVATPTAWGLGVSTLFGQMIAAGQVDNVGTLLGFVSDGDLSLFDGLWPTIAPTATVPIGAGATVQYTLIPNVHFPYGTRTIRVYAIADLGSFGGAGNQINLTFSADLTTLVGGTLASITRNVFTISEEIAGNAFHQFSFDVPVANDGLSFPPAHYLQISYGYNAVVGVPAGFVAGNIRIAGWNM